MNGHDPYAYLKDVFTRLPTLPASRIEELLPHSLEPRGALTVGAAGVKMGSPAAYVRYEREAG